MNEYERKLIYILYLKQYLLNNVLLVCFNINCSTDQCIYMHLDFFKISYPTPCTKHKIDRAKTYSLITNSEL